MKLFGTCADGAADIGAGFVAKTALQLFSSSNLLSDKFSVKSQSPNCFFLKSQFIANKLFYWYYWNFYLQKWETSKKWNNIQQRTIIEKNLRRSLKEESPKSTKISIQPILCFFDNFQKRKSGKIHLNRCFDDKTFALLTLFGFRKWNKTGVW